jgi:vitamin B12/bleomycin/antimicrobial peptide transport system ATP-binding/permease protein
VIGIPKKVNLPWLTFAGWERGRLKGWFWTLLTVVLSGWALQYFDQPAAEAVQQWIFPIGGTVSLWENFLSLHFLAALASCAALHWCLDALLARLPVSIPIWRRRPIPVRLPFGGRTIVTLPEFCQPWLMVALIFAGCWEINTIGVLAAGFNGDLMTALQHRDRATFDLVLGEFAVIIVKMLFLGAVYRLVKEFLILGYTRFCTDRLLKEYADATTQAHYVISLNGSPDNPNERIQQDLPELLRGVLTFLYNVQDSVITLVKFLPLLWLLEAGLNFALPVHGHTVVIEHLMMTALVIYAIFGTNGAVRVGRRLIGMTADQRKRTAYFRVQLVLFEKYAEPIAAYRGEDREREHIWARFTYALSNNYAIVRWSMVLQIFTGAYGKVAQFLPLLALAPFYFNGQVEMGEISKAVAYCGEILAALSLVATGFDSISDIFAYANRVGELRDALKKIVEDQTSVRPRIERDEDGFVDSDILLDIDNVDLYTPGGGKLIVRKLNMRLKRGESAIIMGPSGSGKTTILRSAKGLKTWDYGTGKIRIVPHGKSMMLTQLAYLPNAVNLREQLLYPEAENVPDCELIDALRKVNLSGLIERFTAELARANPGKWDKLSAAEQQEQLLAVTPNWDSLSGGERQRLVTARALVSKVELVLADEATSGLDVANEENLYRELLSHGVTMLSVGHRQSLVKFHQVVYKLLHDGEGGWTVMPAEQIQL